MQTLYEQVGGATVLRSLVDHFYDVMDSDPYALEVRQMHPDDLSSSRDKLYEFLSTWSGGPNLYVERHGPPRMRARHMPFPIDDSAAMQWMHCMRIALAAQVADEDLRYGMEMAFTRIAAHMRNQP